MDLQLRNWRTEVVGQKFLVCRPVVVKRLVTGNLASLRRGDVCRSSCLRVGVLAAGMTRMTRWGEAYQRLHSIDCKTLVCSENRLYDSLLKDTLRVPLHGFLHLHTRICLRRALARCHHDQRLSYRRVSLRTQVRRRYWWSDGVGMVVDLTWLFQRRRMTRVTRPVRALIAQRARLRSHLGTSKGECRLEFE